MIDSSTSSEVEDADYEFDSIINFRDVGKTVNSFLGKKVLKEGLLFRSAKLDDASPKDRLRLTEVYGIKSVIDLRSKTEHLNAEEKHKLLQKTLPLKIPGLVYNRIILPSRRFELFLLWQLSWFNIFKFLLLYIINRPPAISLISQHALGPRGLTNLALDTLTHSPTQISLSLSLLSSSRPEPTIIHCTQGKDRTGLIIILALLILHVPPSAIEHDYHLTNTTDPVIRNIRLEEVREIGLPDSFADTHTEMVTGVTAWLDKNHGGAEGYLDRINFGELKRRRLREVLGYHSHHEMISKSETSIQIPPTTPSSKTSIQISKSETSI